MSKEFVVTLPITGIVEVTVEAENEEEALNLALEQATLKDIVEWEAHKQICEGNVFHGVLNEFDIWS